MRIDVLDDVLVDLRAALVDKQLISSP